MEEGHLYCDSCGEEIRIVPDFEPEIEKEMDDTLSALFSGLPSEEALPGGQEDETENKENIENKKKSEHNKKPGRRRLYLVCAGLLLALGLAGIGLYHTCSVTYQVERAKKAAASEKYTQAISYLVKAHNLKEEDADILFLMADYYYIQEEYDTALQILEGMIQADGKYGEMAVESAYEKAISIYKEEGNYQAINALLLDCGREAIVSRFQQYMAKAPEFSYVGGSYEEVLPLKLSANTGGKIYYTLDGTIPDESSRIYTAPIFLETGTYTVTAYFVNDYGIVSDMVSHTYTIDLPEPSAPEVSVYSGEYHEPKKIEVTASEDCSIYYTTDGTQPTADSFAYTGPLSMPLGTSVYKFVAISSEGISSNVTTRTYTLMLQTQITTEEAIANVKQALIEADILLDENGNMRGMGGHNVYKYNAVVRMENSGDYYVIYEYYEDAAGIQTRTERIYGVSLQDGSPWRIIYDEAGKAALAKIE